MVKNLPAMQETWVQYPGQENPLEKGMATILSILVWETPQTEESGGLQFMGSQRVGHDYMTNILTLSALRAPNPPLQHNTKLLSLVCLTIFIAYSLFLMLTHCLFIGDIQKICRIDTCKNCCYNFKTMVLY